MSAQVEQDGLFGLEGLWILWTGGTEGKVGLGGLWMSGQVEQGGDWV